MTEPDRQTRAPIVVVLGHVDAGKTTLLDAVRHTNVVSREAGGITQSIAAWQARTKAGHLITFIDTPGHEVFAGMRSRGAQIADIGILVVAADDGVMPQTRESIQYLQDTNTPFLVAITKVDLPGAQPETVKSQLAQEGVHLEGKGGEVVSIEVVAPQGKGLDELLEMAFLLWQLKGVSANSADTLDVVVVETKVDRRRGPVVLAVVRNGTLKVGDQVVTVDGISAKVRGLFGQDQKPLKEASPTTPVEILGFEVLPPVGAVVTGLRLAEARAQKSTTLSPRLDLDAVSDGFAKYRLVPGFAIVVKADTNGSLEALTGRLAQMGVSVVSAGTGDVAERDVMLASATGSEIVGFNVRVTGQVKKLADEEGVAVYTYRVIYELLQDVERWQKGKEEASREKILGRASIIAQFPHTKTVGIAGCLLQEGRIAKNDKLRLVRDGQVLGQMRIMSLKKQKAEVDRVGPGEEFGVIFKPQLDFKLGDMVESYQPAVSAAPKS